MPGKGIALAGSLIIDYYKEIDCYPTQSTLATIRKIGWETGGLVCNCALGLSRIDPGLPIQAIGRIGADEAGRNIRQKLASHENIRLDRIVDDTDTSFTDAMLDSVNKTRTYFHYRGANARFCEADFRLDSLECDILHAGYILLLDALDAPDPEFGTVLARVLRKARAKGIRTSIDIVSEASDRFGTLVPPALKYADYGIINEYEGAKTTGIAVRDAGGRFLVDRAMAVCDRLLAMGVSTWAVLHAREGAVGRSSDGAAVILPALVFPAENIISTIGAGDAFLSGCLYGAYTGLTLETAMKAGIAAATASLTRFNTTDGILPASQLLDYYDQTPKEAWPGFPAE